MATITVPARGLPIGLTGAVSPTRYVGSTASVAPVSGTFAVGDFIVTAAGAVYVCTVAGTPGTWVTSGFANPMTTQGDVIFGGASGLPTRLAIGAGLNAIIANAGGTAPSYAASIQSLLTTQGDTMQASAANTPARLAIGTAFRAPRVNAGATALEYGATFPAFLAYRSADSVNQTGAGLAVTVPFDTEVFDQAGDFAANVFTARVTGLYRFSAFVRFESIPIGSTSLFIELVTSNRTYRREIAFTAAVFASFNEDITVLADMDIGDTALVSVRLSGGAGNTATIAGSASPIVTSFSGELVA